MHDVRKNRAQLGWRWLVLVGLLVVAASVSGQEANSPLDVVRSTVDRVIAVLADKSVADTARKRQVRAIINEHFDFIAMSNRVLATNWRKASRDQRARFTALFRELLTNTYWQKLSGYTDEKVVYSGARRRSDKLATVNTVIETATADIPVDYMLYAKDGRWLAYDVIIEQISLVRNYRGSFQDIVHQDGIDGLIKQLEVKVAESSPTAE